MDLTRRHRDAEVQRKRASIKESREVFISRDQTWSRSATNSLSIARRPAAALPFNKSFHLRRQRTLKPKRFAADRMLESQQPGVQRQAAFAPLGMARQFRLITLVAQNRMPRLGKVNANLIAPASFQAHLHQRGPFETSNHAVVRNSDLPDRFIVG